MEYKLGISWDQRFNMVSKELQDKFYAALESLRDDNNGFILEALKAGAKATFESWLDRERTWKVDPEVQERIPDNEIGPATCHKFLTEEDLLKLQHDPSTEENEDPEELNFDKVTGKSFPTYPGQFSEEDDYAMVAEAVTKLGNTIDAMKTDDNTSLLEAIKEGYKAAFEGIVDKDADEIALDKFVDAFSNSITDLSLRRDGMTECTVMFAGEPVGKVSVVMDRDIGDAGRYTPKFTIISTATGEQFDDLPESGPFGASDDTYRKLADNAASFIVLQDKEKLSSLMYDGAGTECDAGVEAVQAEAERKSI